MNAQVIRRALPTLLLAALASLASMPAAAAAKLNLVAQYGQVGQLPINMAVRGGALYFGDFENKESILVELDLRSGVQKIVARGIENEDWRGPYLWMDDSALVVVDEHRYGMPLRVIDRSSGAVISRKGLKDQSRSALIADGKLSLPQEEQGVVLDVKTLKLLESRPLGASFKTTALKNGGGFVSGGREVLRLLDAQFNLQKELTLPKPDENRTDIGWANALLDSSADVVVYQAMKQVFVIDLKTREIICKMRGFGDSYQAAISGDLVLIKPKLSGREEPARLYDYRRRMNLGEIPFPYRLAGAAGTRFVGVERTGPGYAPIKVLLFEAKLD